jgi:hypothetical protein
MKRSVDPERRAAAAARRLPPIHGLRALEAAARHRSYSRAAEELAVTHGAVSQQIRRLEIELEAQLFERRGNEMIPTADARRLAGEVRRSFELLRHAVAEFACPSCWRFRPEPTSSCGSTTDAPT